MKLSEMKKEEQKSSTKEHNIQESYDEIKNESSDELMARLAKEIQGQKENGTFDYDGIVSSINQVKDFLPKQTYENMIRIIDSLK